MQLVFTFAPVSAQNMSASSIFSALSSDGVCDIAMTCSFFKPRLEGGTPLQCDHQLWSGSLWNHVEDADHSKLPLLLAFAEDDSVTSRDAIVLVLKGYASKLGCTGTFLWEYRVRDFDEYATLFNSGIAVSSLPEFVTRT